MKISGTDECILVSSFPDAVLDRILQALLKGYKRLGALLLQIHDLLLGPQHVVAPDPVRLYPFSLVQPPQVAHEGQLGQRHLPPRFPLLLGRERTVHALLLASTVEVGHLVRVHCGLLCVGLA